MRAYTSWSIDAIAPLDFCNVVRRDLIQDFNWNIEHLRIDEEFCGIVMRGDWEGFGNHITWRNKLRMAKSEPAKVADLNNSHALRCDAVRNLLRRYVDGRAATAPAQSKTELYLAARELELIGFPSCLVAVSYHSFCNLLIDAARRGDDSCTLYVQKPFLLIETFFEHR